MYALKPILTQQNIELPASIYKMSPINSSLVENTQISKNKSVSCSTKMVKSLKFDCLLGKLGRCCTRGETKCHSQET